MKAQLSSNPDVPVCGFGLTGLCCSACLSGPCRISPFDKNSGRGKCGASAEQLVAGNLLRMIAAEASAHMAELARLINRVQPQKPPFSASAADLFTKYDLDAAAVKQTGSASLMASEMVGLLALNQPASEVNPLLTRLYPKAAFPHFYNNGLLPSGSLLQTVLCAHQTGRFNAATIEDMLRLSLKVSLVDLVCRELLCDLRAVVDENCVRKPKKRQDKIIKKLTPIPAADDILLLTDGEQPSGWLDRETDMFRNAWEGTIIDITRPADLFGIARRFHQTCSYPIVDTSPLVIAVSPSPALICGILDCGYPVISCPGLPLFGSEYALKFFSEDLRRLTGSVYPAAAGDDLLSQAVNYFREKS